MKATIPIGAVMSTLGLGCVPHVKLMAPVSIGAVMSTVDLGCDPHVKRAEPHSGTFYAFQ